MAKSLDMRTAVKRITSHAYGRSLLALQSAAELAALLAGEALSAASLTLSGDLSVGDDLTVTDDATIGGDLAVTGALTLGGSSVSTSTACSLSGVHANASGLTVRLLRIGAARFYYVNVGTPSGTISAGTTLATLSTAADRPTTNLRVVFVANGNVALGWGLISTAGAFTTPSGLPTTSSFVGYGFEIT